MGLNNSKVIGTVTIRTGSMNPVEIKCYFGLNFHELTYPYELQLELWTWTVKSQSQAVYFVRAWKNIIIVFQKHCLGHFKI